MGVLSEVLFRETSMKGRQGSVAEPDRVPEHWRAVYSDYVEFLDVPRADAILTIMCRGGPPPARLGKHSELVVVDMLLDEHDIEAPSASTVGVPGEAHVIAAVPGSLPFADEQFDLVSLSTSLTLLPDPVAMVRELARVLVPGGMVGGILPSRKLDRAALGAYREEHDLPDDLLETLERFCATFPEGPPERWLAHVLLDGGLRAIRTRESLEDLLLLYKARR